MYRERAAAAVGSSVGQALTKRWSLPGVVRFDVSLVRVAGGFRFVKVIILPIRSTLFLIVKLVKLKGCIG